MVVLLVLVVVWLWGERGEEHGGGATTTSTPSPVRIAGIIDETLPRENMKSSESSVELRSTHLERWRYDTPDYEFDECKCLEEESQS